MSTQGTKRPLRGYVRDVRRKKIVLEVDLNDTPQLEGIAVESSSNHAASQVAHASGVSTGVRHSSIDLIDINSLDPLPSGLPVNRRSTPIDVDVVDDDVIISSPRHFAQARNQIRRRNQVRNPGVINVDEDLDVHQVQSDNQAIRATVSNRGSHERNLPVKIGRNQGRNSQKRPADAYINIDQIKEAVVEAPKEPIFSCAICMGSLVEETSTICGHIFCGKCIKTAIATSKKCPTCRKNLKANNIHRVYLPTTN